MTESSGSNELALRWYRQFSGIIRQAVSSRTERPVDVEDLSQEVYLRLLRIPHPERIDNPQAYMYRIALNVAEEWRQRAVQRVPHLDSIDELQSEVDVYNQFGLEERKNTIEESLKSLPATHRTAVILHTCNDMTYDEIATHMSVSRRAVKRYMALAYATLRDSLRDSDTTTEGSSKSFYLSDSKGKGK